MSRISNTVREKVRERANRRCEYCRTPEGYSRFSHQADHVMPPRHGGTDEIPNLAWACYRCNNLKGTDIATLDFESGQKVWLYNPREQKWDEHFQLDESGTIIGKTAVGRATARLLGMNDLDFPKLRRLLRQTNRW